MKNPDDYRQSIHIGNEMFFFWANSSHDFQLSSKQPEMIAI